MNELTLICKTVVSVVISIATAVVAYKTDEPSCLWALFFVSVLWS